MRASASNAGSLLVTLFALVSLLLTACALTSNDDGTACGSTGPESCPTTPLSYATTIAPLIHDHCAGCHSAGWIEAKHPLDTYPRLTALRLSAYTQVLSCRMPPASEPPLTHAERLALIDWFSCGGAATP